MHGPCLRFVGANLGRFSIVECQREDADFERAALMQCAFLESELRGAKAAGVPIIRVAMPGADLREVDLHHAQFECCALPSSRLDGADLAATCFIKTALRRASVRGVELHYSSFSFAQLAGSDLSEAYGMRVQFCGAGLQGTRFDSARLPGAGFFQARCAERVAATKSNVSASDSIRRQRPAGEFGP